MLRLLVTKKYYDNKTGLLIGYRVKNIDTGEETDASKDAVKNMAIRGELEIVNMRLTSDGRLIGRAMKKLQQKPVKQGTGRKVTRVYTNGRKIACVLVDENEMLNRTKQVKWEHVCIENGFTFDVGSEASKEMAQGGYDNVKFIDGKVVLAPEIKKQSYKSIKDRLVRTLLNNNIHTTLSVNKGEKKYEYAVVIDDYSKFERQNVMVQVILVLMENAFTDAKMRTLYIDEDTMYVQCMTGINDVRKALKDAGIQKI